jgi:hypothetical protein
VISECLFEVMLDEFVMVIGRTKMAYNGTAVVVGCVTSAANRPESRFAAGGNK